MKIINKWKNDEQIKQKLYFIISKDIGIIYVLFIKITMSTPTFSRQYNNTKNKSPNKSQSRIKLSTVRSTSSNFNAKKPKLSQQSLATKMKSMRDKLCNILDAHILIIQTNAPMRCLEHNSVISLYCETQQRLLCANCVYRTNNHKLHRVSPLQKCYRQISRDVDQMSRQVERQIEWAESSTKSIHQFFKEQQKNANQAILTLAQMYDQLHIELQKSFDQVKKKLMITMDQSFSKKQFLLLQIQFYRNILEKNKPIPIQDFQSRDTNTAQYHLIFRHLIGCSLLDFGKFDGNKVIDGPSRIKQMQKKQIQKLSQIKLLMERWKEEQKQRQYSIIQKQRQKQRQRINKSLISQKQKQGMKNQDQRPIDRLNTRRNQQKQSRRQPPKIIN